MLNSFWKKFKSGSDIRGTASDGVDGQPVELTDEVCEKIAASFLSFLKDKTQKSKVRIAVGHDSRISADRICAAVVRTLKKGGADVAFCGLSSTPSMFMITKDAKYNCDGSIQITASHHPFNKNGLKFFTDEGGLSAADIEQILLTAQTGGFTAAKEQGSVYKVSYLSEYAQTLVNFVRNKTGEQKPLEHKKIVVDAGNGAGGFFATQVLLPLGADISSSQFLEPDGMFPDHVPNPEDKAAMQSVCRRVIETKADLGIIFDTDVDRAGAVDSSGGEINRNRLIALISAVLLKERTGAAIVTDSVTSSGLKKFISQRGGVHHRYKRGYKNVIDEAIRLNKNGIYCPLAIETSGHAAFLENHFLDDGAYLITRLLVTMSELAKENKPLLSLIDGLEEPLEQSEIRLTFKNADNFKAYGDNIIDNLLDNLSSCNVSPEDSTYEGARINFNDDDISGWVLVRMSVHDPVMPINIESNAAGGNKKIAAALYGALKQYDNLDLTALEKYIS